jgi:hypothetical protein
MTYQSASRPYKFPEGGAIYEQLNEPEEYRTPSEDSGVGMGPAELVTRWALSH